MRVHLWGTALTCGLALTWLAACSSGPEAPRGVAQTNQPMQESPNVAGTLVWRKPGLNPAQYTSFIISQPTVYQGSDASWGGATDADKQSLAQYMNSDFRRALSQKYRITTTPGPNTARLDLMLVGLGDNVPVVATVSRVAPVGIVSNVVRSAAGEPPTFTGNATIKGEFFDSQNGQPLATFVTTQSPKAIDIGATLTSRDAQQAAIDAAASNLIEGMSKAQSASLPIR